MNRRNFVKKGALLVAAGLGVPTFLAETARVLQHGGAPSSPLGLLPGVATASPRAQSDPSRRILVVLQLAGGNDGINTLIPYGDQLYYDARPSLAIPRD